MEEGAYIYHKTDNFLYMYIYHLCSEGGREGGRRENGRKQKERKI